MFVHTILNDSTAQSPARQTPIITYYILLITLQLLLITILLYYPNYYLLLQTTSVKTQPGCPQSFDADRCPATASLLFIALITARLKVAQVWQPVLHLQPRDAHHSRYA